MKLGTRLVHFDACPEDPFRPVATPIYQTTTFEQESAIESGQYDYSRSGNPTRTVLEEQLARIEGGTRAFAFASGLAAITAVARLLAPGDEIVACDDLYGGTYRLFSKILKRSDIRLRYVAGRDPKSFRDAFSACTRLVYIETPTNPLLEVLDIAAIAKIAHEPGALLCVDNSVMSPYLQRPLELGADIVVHSATKYLCGHSDVTAGVAVVKDDALAEELYLVQNGEGAGLAPFDCFLFLRGLKTLGLRMDRQQQSAQHIADLLAKNPLVRRVHYPGLAAHPRREVHLQQARGAGALLSFETGSFELSRRIVEAARIFAITVSFGSVNSSISLPGCMSHKSIPAELAQSKNLPSDLVRLSVGIEDVDDLTEDLAQAFEIAAAQTALAPEAVAG